MFSHVKCFKWSVQKMEILSHTTDCYQGTVFVYFYFFVSCILCEHEVILYHETTLSLGTGMGTDQGHERNQMVGLKDPQARNTLPKERKWKGAAISCTASEMALSPGSQTHRQTNVLKALTLNTVLHSIMEKATGAGSSSSLYQNNVSKLILLLTVLPLSF